jgi:hypothetical protein
MNFFVRIEKFLVAPWLHPETNCIERGHCGASHRCWRCPMMRDKCARAKAGLPVLKNVFGVRIGQSWRAEGAT